MVALQSKTPGWYFTSGMGLKAELMTLSSSNLRFRNHASQAKMLPHKPQGNLCFARSMWSPGSDLSTAFK